MPRAPALEGFSAPGKLTCLVTMGIGKNHRLKNAIFGKGDVSSQEGKIFTLEKLNGVWNLRFSPV